MRNRLRAFRVSRELTQAALAERAGVSRQTIVSIERGHFDPSLPLAFRLAGLFGVAIEDLFIPAESDGVLSAFQLKIRKITT
jgi:putative transcriptional regulator